MVSKFIKRGTNKENVWEHGNIGQFWKGTRTPPGRPSPSTENTKAVGNKVQTGPAETFRTLKFRKVYLFLRVNISC